MNGNINEINPRSYARAGGIAYLVIIAAGFFTEMVIRNAIIVPGDAAATAKNLLASPLLWRIGIAADLLMHVCDMIVLLVMYTLLKPVNKNLALLMVFFNMIQTAVLVANNMNMMTPMFLSGSADYLHAFTPDQLQALAYTFIRAHGYGFGSGLIFFGCACLISGYLIFRSGYFPKIIGVMIQLAGICYLINSFALIIAPEFAHLLFPAILLPAFAAETSLCLWLIIKGVKLKEWNETTGALYIEV